MNINISDLTGNLRKAIEYLLNKESQTELLSFDKDLITFKCKKCGQIYTRNKNYLVRQFEVLKNVTPCTKCFNNYANNKNKTIIKDYVEHFYKNHSRDEYEIIRQIDDSNEKSFEIKHKVCGNVYTMDRRNAFRCNCPKCINLSKTNNLLMKFPSIVEKYWDYEANELTPDKVTPYSTRLVHCKCKDCGSEFVKSVKELHKSKACDVCNELRYSIKDNNEEIKYNRDNFKKKVSAILTSDVSKYNLSNKENDFLNLFFITRFTMTKIGQIANLSRERVRQIIVEGLTKLGLNEEYKAIFTDLKYQK